ncbi:MAG: PDZ domain-containing protein, partial [bacterium]
RSWFGLGLQSLQDSPETEGVLVGSVYENSPATEANIQPGWRLHSINGQEVGALFANQLVEVEKQLARLPVGEKAQLEFYTENGIKKINISSREFVDKIGRRFHLPEWGINLRELTWWLVREENLPVDRGLLVTGLRTGGPAAEASPALREDDIITSINGDTLIADKEKLTEFDTDLLLLNVIRDNSELVVGLNPDEFLESEQRPREFSRPWLGVRLQVLTAKLRKKIAADLPPALRVTEVFERTTAREAGLEVGDIITAVDGDELNVSREHHTRRFFNMLERYSIGDTVVLTVRRSGREKQINARLEASPAYIREANRFQDRRFGLKVREVMFRDKIKNSWPAGLSGVLVRSVESGGWAGLAGLRAGDLIVSIAGESISSLQEYRKKTKELHRKKPGNISMFIYRNQRSRYLFLTPKWTD